MEKDGFSNKVEGKLDKVSGKVKESVGEATDNHSLENEGKKEQFKGNVKEKVGKVQQDLEDLTKDRR